MYIYIYICIYKCIYIHTYIYVQTHAKYTCINFHIIYDYNLVFKLPKEQWFSSFPVEQSISPLHFLYPGKHLRSLEQ